MHESNYYIELKDLEFYSFHGLHEEEKRIGGQFRVNLKVGFSSQISRIADVDQTINYVSLFKILKKEMAEPRELLETLAGAVIDQVQEKFATLNSAEIRIEKLNPPIEFIQGNVSVTLIRHF